MKTLALLLVACGLTINLSAQTKSTAPIVWERYKVSDRNISFVFPKMPTVDVVPSMCGEVAVMTYLAYAKGAIYEFVIAGPRRSVTQVNCGGKIVSYKPKKLEERLAELRKLDGDKEERVTIGKTEAYHFTSRTTKRWIFPNETTPARWIEVAVTHHSVVKPEPEKVLESIVFNAAEGKEIGKGSPVTLGDEGIANSTTATALGMYGRATSGLVIYMRPTTYVPTEGFKGQVRLTIQFLANGSIGRVEPDKKDPLGLSEIAIASARKISFLPMRVNNLPVDLEQTMVYDFLGR